jgi:hypothetical protein
MLIDHNNECGHRNRQYYMRPAICIDGSAYVVKPRLSLDLLSAIKAVLSNELFVSASLLNEPV